MEHVPLVKNKVVIMHCVIKAIHGQNVGRLFNHELMECQYITLLLA